MPVMNGLQAAELIIKEVPTRIVVVMGALMRSETDLIFRAMQAGALTAVRTPGLDDEDTCKQLAQTIRLMARVPVVRRWDRDRSNDAPAPPQAFPQITERPNKPVKMIRIASSTGRPRALASVLKPLPADFPTPILVVQHAIGHRRDGGSDVVIYCSAAS